jgi:hypothetical protein
LQHTATTVFPAWDRRETISACHSAGAGTTPEFGPFATEVIDAQGDEGMLMNTRQLGTSGIATR